MSNREKYDDVSLDKIAVINILNWLDYAGQAIISGDTTMALEDVDMAWAKLPNALREKMIRPSEQLQKKVEEELVSAEDMTNDVRFKQYSQRVILRTENEIIEGIGERVVKSCLVEIITLLDKYNLYIRKENQIQVTSQKEVKEQPPMNKLPPTMTRETS